MPQTIQVDGKDVTVYTEAEMKEQSDAAITAATKPYEDQLAQAKADLAKGNDKDTNFAHLRKTVEDLEKKIGTAKDDALAQFQAESLQKMAAQAIVSLADGDAELQKKIEHHYKKQSVGIKTDDEARAAVRDAFFLARKGDKEPSGFADAFGGAGGSGAPAQAPKPVNGKEPLTDNQTKFLRIAYPGLTDEEIAKLDADAKPPRTGPIDGNFKKITV